MKPLRVFTCILLALISSALVAQTPTPTSGPTAVPTPRPTPWSVVGPEFPVNTTTSGSQTAPVVAIGADDGFVVAWTDDQQDGSGRGIFARRFDAAGLPLSGEFQVNTLTTDGQYDPAIASDAAGNFVVVWSSSPDSSGGADVFARRFDADGNPAGPEFMVNTHTMGFQAEPDVAMNFSGDFVVVWSSVDYESPPQDGSFHGIFARRYDASGNPVTDEFQVNSYTTGMQFEPAVDMQPDGFVVVWTSAGQDGPSEGVFGQFFSKGDPAGDEFQVNTFTSGDQSEPDVAINDAGGFVVVFQSAENDGSQLGIFGRIFDSNPNGATGIGTDFQINTHTTASQLLPRVATCNLFGPGLSPLSFITTWLGSAQDDPSAPELGVFGQRFANAPTPTSAFFLANPPRIGSEYQINTTTTGNQSRADVAANRRGQFVVAWESNGQDGDGYGVFARRFGFPDAQPMEVDQKASSGVSNVNGVLEPGERVAVGPSWSNISISPLSLEGTASNLTGPPGPSYAIDDDVANYGDIPPFQTNACTDCYEVTVDGARPTQHWDATLDEYLTSSGPLGPSRARHKTWALHVGGSFNDVPTDSFYPFIENIFHHRVTAGGGCGAGNFCGEDSVLRQQMAVFLLKARDGAEFVPAPATGAVFDDVPASSPFARWIEELARLAVTAGCTAPPPPALPSYCPTSPVNRQQMAVFLLKALYGGGFIPFQCFGIFEDVPCTNYPFANYIEYLTALDITAGCQASPPLYCPTESTKRKQMAPFLVKTFGLQLYGPD